MRPSNEVRPIDRADSVQHLGDVLRNGIPADVQFLGDLDVGTAFRDML
jgi:hypothetical protein